MTKGTIFIDLDGTILEHSTGELLEGARAFLQLCDSYELEKVFVTRRGNKEWSADHPVYSEAATRAVLKRHGLDDCRILFAVRSPRFLIDDSAIAAIPLQANAGFDGPMLENIESFFNTMT
jgi:hypothetical protein